ncbi:hypothetical protein [Ponticaulis sp.]|uniref:hypothetical protein n=1 Tax=Ponticaulis sp. TaxID=2020902 RepID=UPI000B69945D|nr:hypothetical protein [Ponticaulis sp.]MAJ09064.1 hypothetical protein [Ponticaulis sp.]RPG16856.1 MAG: hypothetical protein CBC85_008025 [Hyphomonadaceae bacterium TMED125]|tara:strand:+ start:3237 stop:3887 length:651 start_codon:yes stop_codon:yes gene_type:complete
MPDETESFDEAYAAMRSDSGYQFELPVDPIDVTPDAVDPDRNSGWRFFDAIGDMIAALGPLWRVLLIGAAVLLVAYIIYSVVKGVMDRRQTIGDRKPANARDELADVDLRPDESFSSDLLKRADALADTGDFDAAVRLMLHSSFQEMQKRVRDRIGKSLTGREIGELGQMPEPSRDALRRLILSVERSAFAGQHLTSEDYQAARQDYDVFAQRAAS